jgi:NTE family protein
MNFQLQPHLTAAKRKLPFECVTLLLQGGGALGAYQGGVYEALAEADIHPNWIAGISIGAINAAIIAGNPPNSHRPIARVLDAGDFERALGLVRQSIR